MRNFNFLGTSPIPIPTVLALACAGCFADFPALRPGEQDTGSDADADGDTDADTDVDADADTDTDADSDGDADADADSDTDSDSDSDTDADADSDSDADTDSDTDTDADTDSGTQPETSCAWRMQLTFDNTGSSETLLDFPLPLALDASAIDYAHTADSGEDVLFTDADGVTMIPHEIERWDEAGTSFLWVRIPAIDSGSATDHAWMYFGCTGTAAQDPAGVWDDGFVAVWHLSDPADDELSSAAHADATGGGSTGAQNGNAAAEGVFAGAQDFDGDDFVDVPDSAALDVTGPITVEAWASFDDLSGNNEFRYVAAKYDTGWNDRSYALYLYEDNPRFIVSWDGVDATTAAPSGTAAATGQWYYLVGVYTGGSGAGAVRIYVDGALGGTDTGPVPAQIHAGAADLTIGAKFFAGETNCWMDARIDEVRVSAVARSDAWIATQHLAMTGGFVTFGDEQAL